MPQTNLDLTELRRLVDEEARLDAVRVGANPGSIDGLVKNREWHMAFMKLEVALMRDAPALLDEIERLRKVEAAAREFLDAYDIGHEEEHMFVDALRKALGGEDGE